MVHLNFTQKNIYKNIRRKTDPAGWPAVHNNKHDESKCAWPVENIFNSFPWEMHIQGPLWLCLFSVSVQRVCEAFIKSTISGQTSLWFFMCVFLYVLHPETANKEYIKRSSGKYIWLFYPLVWRLRWEFQVSRRGRTFCTVVLKSMFLDLDVSSSLSISFHYVPFIIFYFLKWGLLTQLSVTFRDCCCCWILSQFIFGCMGNVHTQLIIPSSTQEWS